MYRASVQLIRCVSHQCVLWGDAKVGEGRHLTREERDALSKVHALAHRNKPVTVADLLGEPENDK
jgi:hypothetical protein